MSALAEWNPKAIRVSRRIFVAGPGYGGDDHAVLRAADPWRIGLEVRPGEPEVGCPPAPPSVAPVVAGRAPPTDPAAVPVSPSQPDRDDERAGRLLEPSILDDRPLDTEQVGPYPHPAHAVSSPWLSLTTQTMAGGVRCCYPVSAPTDSAGDSQLAPSAPLAPARPVPRRGPRPARPGSPGHGPHPRCPRSAGAGRATAAATRRARRAGS